jgi:hypothetical protein
MEEPESGKTILLKVIHQGVNAPEMYKSPRTHHFAFRDLSPCIE